MIFVLALSFITTQVNNAQNCKSNNEMQLLIYCDSSEPSNTTTPVNKGCCVPPPSSQPIVPQTNIQPYKMPTIQPLPSQQVTNVPQQTSVQNIQLGQPISQVLKDNLIAKTELMNFLEYNGIPPPWDQLLDFETTRHHQLPDPDTMFSKIKKQLLDFDKTKMCIVESLMTIEKFISRGKTYLAEDLKDLCQDKIMLKNILKRLCANPAYEFRNVLFKRFADIKCRSEKTKKSFYKLRDWLSKVRKWFKTL